MTPQAPFMVHARILPDKREDLEKLLASMNQTAAPGSAEPLNPLVPFGEFGTLHFARFVIMEDKTLGDFEFWDLPVPETDVSLVFLGDCDGPADDMLAAFAENDRAAKGLRAIFAHCDGFEKSPDLLSWMRVNSVAPAANYVNWIGRTVVQVRKEAALRARLQGELAAYVAAHPDAGEDPHHLHQHLRSFAEQHSDLIPARTRTPLGWWLSNALHYAILPFLLVLPWPIMLACSSVSPFWLIWVVPPFLLLALVVFVWLTCVARATFALLVALGLMLLPFFILFPLLLVWVGVPVALFLVVLRCYEKSEPNVIPPPTLEHDIALARCEDHNITNQYSLMSCVKPSAFRRAMFVVVLWLTNYGSRHIYNRGYLARIQTIHFARWVTIDGNTRAFFYSNYDGSHQAYMDDFINKVGWGLNIVFSHGFGYPRTNWLVMDGAADEQRFKDANRRHQIATQAWYNAYPGLTALDLARNTRVRKGLQRGWMRKAAIRTWLRDL